MQFGAIKTNNVKLQRWCIRRIVLHLRRCEFTRAQTYSACMHRISNFLEFRFMKCVQHMVVKRFACLFDEIYLIRNALIIKSPSSMLRWQTAKCIQISLFSSNNMFDCIKLDSLRPKQSKVFTYFIYIFFSLLRRWWWHINTSGLD